MQTLFDSDNSVLPWSLARAWAAAGKVEKAVVYLKEAFETHSSSMPFLGQTPVFVSMQMRPEIQQMVKDLGLQV